MFLQNLAVYEIMWNYIVCTGRTQMTIGLKGMLDTQGYKQILRICNFFLLSFCNYGCTNAPECYVISTLLVLFALSD